MGPGRNFTVTMAPALQLDIDWILMDP